MAKAQAKKDDNVVELRKNGPSEDAFKLVNLGKLLRADEDLQNAKNTHQSVVKHVETKINVKAARWAQKVKKSGKLEEAVEEMSARLDFARILLGEALMTKAQMEMFPAKDAREPAIDRARSNGRIIGLMGLGQDQCPYAPESEQGIAWGNAFKEGGDERKLALSMEPAGDELIKGGADDDVFDEDED